VVVRNGKWRREKRIFLAISFLATTTIYYCACFSVYVGKDLSTMKFSLAAIALLKSVAAVVPSSWEGNMNNQMVRRSVVSSDDF
jgi:hypothetical protein